MTGSAAGLRVGGGSATSNVAASPLTSAIDGGYCTGLPSRSHTGGVAIVGVGAPPHSHSLCGGTFEPLRFSAERRQSDGVGLWLLLIRCGRLDCL